jgi:hypothetical protein
MQAFENLIAALEHLSLSLVPAMIVLFDGTCPIAFFILD